MSIREPRKAVTQSQILFIAVVLLITVIAGYYYWFDRNQSAQWLVARINNIGPIKFE